MVFLSWLRPLVARRLFLSILAGALGAGAPARAADQPASPEIIRRYEQILEKAPMAGEPFDRVVQESERGEGLDQLDRRWAQLGAQPGAIGAAYSVLRGLLADRTGRLDDARRLLESATAAQPDDFHGWLALGDCASHQGQWAAAGDAYQKGLAAKVAGEDRLTLFRKLGEAQERNLDLTGALATWRRMVAEFPDDPFAVAEAADAELGAGQYDEARQTFQKAVDLTDPGTMDRVQALMRLAEVDDRQGRPEEAVKGYENILPLTAEGSWLNREVRSTIEQVYRRDNDLTGLAAYYQRWTAANPKDVGAWLLLGDVLAELDRQPEALDALRQATALAPDRHEVRATLGERLIAAKQFDEAVTGMTSLTADDPTEPRYWQILGEALWQKTQPPTAENKQAALDAWRHLTLTPPGATDVAAIVAVADLLADHHLAVEALADYRRALALTPDASDLRAKAARLLVAENRPNEAWALLDGLVAGDRATGRNFLRLAELDLDFKRDDAAAAAIGRGLEIEPTNFALLTLEWDQLAKDQKWPDAAALYGRLRAAAPDPAAARQVESRQLQALASAGQLDETAQRLEDRLETASEAELQLLLRILIQRSDGATAPAFAEAHRRFPQSIGVLQLESDYDRKRGDFDAAIMALRALVAIDPLEQTNWLGAIVQVRRDQGKPDEALAACDELIAAAPTSEVGYLLYSEIAEAAGKTNQVFSRLQAAIRQVDRPNEVRQRLARLYLDAGEPAKARELDDEAFAAATEPTERLAIVRQMAAAYYQTDRIEELLSRFKDEQKSDPEGGGFGVYLAAIYEEMQDPGAARRELAKELAIHPHDLALLRSLVELAEQEDAPDELLRYRTMLAEADPSSINLIALAGDEARHGNAAEAWRIMREHETLVLKDPVPWSALPAMISDPEVAKQAGGLLDEAIAQRAGAGLGGKFTLGQFQMLEGKLDDAEKTFWDLLAAPLPDPVAPATAGVPWVGGVSGTILYNNRHSADEAPHNYQVGSPRPLGGDLQRRLELSANATNEAQQILAAGASRGGGNGGFNPYAMMGAGVVAPDPTTVHENAAAYLMALARQRGDNAKFLVELKDRLASLHRSIADRLLIYSVIQTPEAMLETIEEEVKATGPDPVADEFSLVQTGTHLSSNLEPGLRNRVAAAQASLLARSPAANAGLVNGLLFNQAVADYDRLPSEETKSKWKAAAAAYLQTVDRHDPSQLLDAIIVAGETGDGPRQRAALEDLQAIPGLWNRIALRGYLETLPILMLQYSARGVPANAGPPELAALTLKAIELSWPTAPPPPTPSPQGQFGDGITFANRYFGESQDQLDVFGLLKYRKLLPALEAALAEESKTGAGWRQMYPILLRGYFQWWDGRKDEAVASLRLALDRQPDDDLRRTLGEMLIDQKKFAEAIPILEAVTARYGPMYLGVQTDLLAAAAQARNSEAGQRAGRLLLAANLPPYQAAQILANLRSVGLTSQAAELRMRLNAANSPNNGSKANFPVQVPAADLQLLRSLQSAVRNQNADKVAELARQILSHDPKAQTASPLADELRSQALAGLQAVGRLDAYALEVSRQAVANPASTRAVPETREAIERMPRTVQEAHRARGEFDGPTWLKLARTGDRIVGSHSANGRDWSEVFSREMKLGPTILAGVTAAGASQSQPLEFHWSELRVRASGGTPPGESTAAAWQYSEVGTPAIPGGAAWDAGRLTLTAPAFGELPDRNEEAASYENLQAMIDGAGFETVTASPAPSPFGPEGLPLTGGFLHQTIAGDGEIIGLMGIDQNPGDRGNSGLSFRADAEGGSPEIRLWVGADHALYFTATDEARNEAVGNLGHLAALPSANPDLKDQMIGLDLQTGRTQEALGFLVDQIKANPAAGPAVVSSHWETFAAAGQLAKLIELAKTLNPPSLNPNGGPAPAEALLGLSGSLEWDGLLPEAETMARKAVALASGDSKATARLKLAHLLAEEDKPEEAAAEMENWFRGEPAAAAPWLGPDTAPPSSGRESLFANGIDAESKDFSDLDFAVTVGARLLEIMRTEPPPARTASVSGMTGDEMIRLYLEATTRDPACRSDLEQALVKFAAPGNQTDAGRNYLLNIARNLSVWPEQQAGALKVDQTMLASPTDSENEDLRDLARLQTFALAQALGDHAITRPILLQYAAQAREAQNPKGESPPRGQFLDRLSLAVPGMIQEGMDSEAAGLLEDARAHPSPAESAPSPQSLPMVAGGDPEAGPREVLAATAWWQARLDSAEGLKPPTALITGLERAADAADGKPAAAEFFWESQVVPRKGPPEGNSDAGQSPGYGRISQPAEGTGDGPMPGWVEALPSHPTDNRIEIEGGPDENHLRHLTVLEKVASTGHARVMIPADAAVLRAKLWPAARNLPPLAVGRPITIGIGVNLLPNPNLTPSREPDGPARVADWSGPGLPWFEEAGEGPLPSGQHARLPGPVNPIEYVGLGQMQIKSARIPLSNRGTGLVFSGWVSGATSFVFRFLDSRGNDLVEIVPPDIRNAPVLDEWHWVEQRFAPFGDPPDGMVAAIPPQAAFLQIGVYENDGSGSVAGLALRALQVIQAANDAMTKADSPAAVAIAPAPIPPAAGGGAYLVTRLGTLGGRSSYPDAINEQGQIVGSADTSGTGVDGFFYADGKMQDLGELTARASGINDAGQVVGWDGSIEPGSEAAFLWRRGAGPGLGGFARMPDEERPSFAYGINGSGQIVGRRWIEPRPGTLRAMDGVAQAALIDRGTARSLGSLGGEAHGSEARAINDAGQVVGWSETGLRGQRQIHAFLDRDGFMEDLGTLGGDFSVADAINDSGQIVGHAETQAHAIHAFLYRDGQMQDLGGFGHQESSARAINAAGQIVGFAWNDTPDGGFGERRAYLFAGGQAQNLTALVGAAPLAAAGFKSLTEATGINDRGQIIGVGLDARGDEIGFLLTPTAANPTPSATPLADPGKGARFAAGPADGPAAIVKVIKTQMRGQNSPLGEEFTDVSELRIMAPVAAYTIDADKFKDGTGFANAQPTGFKYLIEARGSAMAVADVEVDDTNQAVFQQFVPEFSDLEIAHHELPALPKVEAGSYEVRLVTSPGVPKILWLKADAKGTEDLIYPLADDRGEIGGGLEEKLYPFAEYLKLYNASQAKPKSG